MVHDTKTPPLLPYCSTMKSSLVVLGPSQVSLACSPLGSSVHRISQASSGLPFPSAGDLPDPGIKFKSPALAGGFFTTEPPEKPKMFPRPFQI